MNKKYQTTYHNNSTGQLILPVNTGVLIAENDPVFTFNEVLEGVNLNKYLKTSYYGRPGYNSMTLLKIILFSFMINVKTTRKIADLCAHDIRLMWLGNNIKPSHNVIAHFIKHILTQNIDDILVELNHYFITANNIETDMLYLDGTKIEANANKYTFVWKKAVLKYQTRLYEKISAVIAGLLPVLSQYNIETNIEIKNKYSALDIGAIAELLAQVIAKQGIQLVYGKGKHKLNIQKYYDLFRKYYEKAVEYEEKLEICGEYRNSYAKTDHDATFMRMKEDHMRNGQLKASYNIQIGVSAEYIMNVSVSQDRTDYQTFPVFLNDYRHKYDFMPAYVVADAGYGGYDNYLFCKENKIKLFQKYVMYTKEKEKSFRKKEFNSRNFNYHDNGVITCNEGKKFVYELSSINERGNYPKIIDYYQCYDCHECPKQRLCTKAKDGYRKLQVCAKQRALEKEAKQNLDSQLGIELRVQRSIQVEGAFGVIKQDLNYRRLYRKGLENVKTEVTLVCIGYNLMKYHHKKLRALYPIQA